MAMSATNPGAMVSLGGWNITFKMGLRGLLPMPERAGIYIRTLDPKGLSHVNTL